MLSIFHLNFVLSCTWNVEVSLNFPRLLACEEFSVRIFIRVRSADVLAGCSEFKQSVKLILCVDSIRIIDISIRAGECNEVSAELLEFPSSTPSYVTETGDNNCLTLDVFAVCLQHFLCVPNDTETCSFSSSEASAVRDSLAC